MEINILSPTTLKLVLTAQDMISLDIQYENLSGKDPATKKLLTHVLQSIQNDTNLGRGFLGASLFVEVFPRLEGGCLLYISSVETDSTCGLTRQKQYESEEYTDVDKITLNTKLQKKRCVESKEKTASLMFVSSNISDLSAICKTLICHTKGLLYKSELYALKTRNGECTKYRLFITSDSLKYFIHILREFGGSLVYDEKEFLYTKEHYSVIAEENAVGIIGELF